MYALVILALTLGQPTVEKTFYFKSVDDCIKAFNISANSPNYRPKTRCQVVV